MTMKRPIEQMAEYTDLEPAMDYWLTALGVEKPGVVSQFKDLFRKVYDTAHKQGYQSGVRMVKNTVADIREA